MLTNSLKISHVTKVDIFQLDDLEFIEKYESSGVVLSFSSVSKPLTRWLAKGVLKQDLLDA